MPQLLLRDRKTFHKYVKSVDKGFTLIELLIGIVIVGFISVFLLQFSNQISNNIGVIADRATSAQTIIRFSNLIHYDVAGAQDIYFHGNDYATSGTVCSSATGGAWGNPSELSKNYARGLFTIRINDIPYPGNNPNNSAAPSWSASKYKLVGYEIYRKVFIAGTPNQRDYYLQRVECNPDTLAPISSEKILELGQNLSSLIDNRASFMKCSRSSDPLNSYYGNCPIGSSTSSFDYYNFRLPYQGTVSSLSKLSKESELFRLKRRVEN